MTEGKKQWLIALAILCVFILLWVFLFFMMKSPSNTNYSKVSQLTFETRLKQVSSEIKGEKQEQYIKYQIDEHSEIYVDYQKENISRLLLVFNQENYQETTAKPLLQEVIDICVPNLENNEEIATQLMDFDDKEEDLVANDITMENIEFLSRIDRDKKKVVFYIYYLDNE